MSFELKRHDLTCKPPSVSPAELRAIIAQLCRLGNRFVGSPGERAARRFIITRFQASGLTVREESFDVITYVKHETACSLPEHGLDLPCTGLQFTAPSAAEGNAIYLGAPSSTDDLNQLEARGIIVRDRIAVLSSAYPYRFSASLVARGVKAIVLLSEAPDGLIPHFTARMYPDLTTNPAPLPVPGVTVERSAGQKLLSLLSAGPQRLRVIHEASYPTARTANVVADLAGESDEYVVVGAHYDTQLEGVGAWDNGTGVAALLAFARRWSACRPHRTIRFVAFADEEHGFQGAVNYCRRHAETLPKTAGMVNLDGLAWAYPAARALWADSSMHAFALECARSVGWKPDVQLDASLVAGSDYRPFIDAGVPSCYLHRYPPRHPAYHTAGDTAQFINFDSAAETAHAAAAVALGLAQQVDLDFDRSEPQVRLLDLRPS